MSTGLEYSWPVIYECGRIMREHETYKEKGFESFDAWWADRMGPAFVKWAELEEANHFVSLVAPALSSAGFSEIRRVLSERGKNQDEKTGRFTRVGNYQDGDVTPSAGGTSRAYIIARLIRDGFTEQIHRSSRQSNRRGDEGDVFPQGAG